MEDARILTTQSADWTGEKVSGATRGRAPAPVDTRLFELADLPPAAAWALSSAYYRLLPIPALFLWPRVVGWWRSRLSRERHSVRRNLASVLGPGRSQKELRRIARRHFEYVAQRRLLHVLPRLKRFAALGQWPVEGLEHLDEAVARGAGTILLSGHLGYSVLLKYMLALRGYNVRRVRAGRSRTLKRRRAEAWAAREFSRFRARMCERFHIVEVGLDDDDLVADLNVRPVVESLQRNAIVLVMGDALHAAGFVELNLLGRPYPFPSGYMRIAMETGATVLPTFAVGGSNGSRIRVVIGAPLQIDRQGATRSQLLRTNVERFARLLDGYIVQYPHLYNVWSKDQWFETRLARSRKRVSERY